MCMDRTTLVDFFEDVETTEKYDGYFCSIAEVIGTVVLGSLCGFKNVSQIHHWAAQFLPEDMRTPLCKITSTGEIGQRFRLN